MPVAFLILHLRDADKHGQYTLCGKWSPMVYLTANKEHVGCGECIRINEDAGR